MKAPILLSDWTNQLAYRPGRAKTHLECFALSLAHPHSAQAFHAKWALRDQRNTLQGNMHAVFFNGPELANAAARMDIAPERILLDPERTGMGLASTLLENGASQGEIKGNNTVVSWDIRWDSNVQPYLPLPSEKLYASSWVPAKMCTPVPYAVASGRVEIWEGAHRRSTPHVVSVDGWHLAQSHHFGHTVPGHYATVQCNLLEGAQEGSWFEAYAGRMPVVLGMSREAALGRLVHNGTVYRFDTWKNLSSCTSRHSALDWDFELAGPQAVLRGKVHAPQHHAVALKQEVAGMAPFYVCHSGLAQLSLELHPHGAPSQLIKGRNAHFEATSPTAGNSAVVM